MSTSSWSTGTNSVRARSQRPTDTIQESPYDTALPPIQDKSVSRHRPALRPDSSVIIGNFRGMQRPGFPFSQTHDPMSNMIAQGPAMHRRTESTLKTVMRKIFQRKRRSQTDDPDEDSVLESHQPRPSMARPRPSEHNSAREKVGSQGHSPLQKDVLPTLMSLDRLDPISLHQRRATLPSLVFSDNESHDLLHIPLDKDKPDPRVGTTTNNLRTRRVLRNKRRSRSTNSLRKKATEDDTSPVERSQKNEEITPLGSPVHRAVSDSELSFRPPTRGTITSMTRPSGPPSRPPSVSESEQHTEVESVPPSAGNVGNLINTMQHNDSLTLEQRVTTLEVKLIDLEFAIAHMQDRQGDSSSSMEKSRPKKSPATDATRSQGGKQSMENPSPFSPAFQSLSSHEWSQFSTQEQPLNSATLRPNTLNRSHTCQPPSSPSHMDAGAISIEQYSALVMLLRREQSARRNLEGQISGLRDDVLLLQTMARHSVTSTNMDGTMYPIRSDDSQDASSRMRPKIESPPPSSTYRSRGAKFTPPYDSVGMERADFNDIRKLERRIEIAGMI